LAFERSTSSEGVRIELKAELGEYGRKEWATKEHSLFPQIESRSTG